MAEHRVSIDGGVDSNGNIVRPLPVSIPASSPFYPSSNPSITGAYLFSVENLAGVAFHNVLGDIDQVWNITIAWAEADI